MQSPIAFWQKLDFRRKAVIVGATLGVFLAVLGLGRMAATPQMTLLYAGLDSASAGQVLAALDQQGVRYDIRGNSILVPEDRRDSLRMGLAAEGLPANDGVGYELLDGLSGFGTTSQMFDAAYWRAKEGELARTILANPAIRAARVHIARASERPFARDARSTASVTVTTASPLDRAQANALRHLVAGAVAGMRPEDVSVIDAETGLVGDEVAAAELSGDARAQEIRTNVERLLAAHVGAGRAVVEVAVDLATEREAITERVFDPQGRVAISSDTETKSGSNSDPGGEVTVASNLPDGAAGQGAASQSRSNESRERVNYEVSETQREVLRMPGTLKRLSVAVLVDGRRVTAADGSTTVEPRTEEELAALRELVASAVGLDEARGDVLVLKSMAFDDAPPLGTVAEAGALSALARLDLMTLIQVAVLGLVALVLGLFVLRPALAGNAAPALPPVAPAVPLPPPSARPTVLTGEIDDGEPLPSLQVVSPEEEEPQDPVARLRRLIAARQTETVEILRNWMEHEEGRS